MKGQERTQLADWFKSGPRASSGPASLRPTTEEVRSRGAAGRGGGEREVNVNVSLSHHGAVSSAGKRAEMTTADCGMSCGASWRVTPVDVPETQAAAQIPAALLNHHPQDRSGRALKPSAALTSANRGR